MKSIWFETNGVTLGQAISELGVSSHVRYSPGLRVYVKDELDEFCTEVLPTFQLNIGDAPPVDVVAVKVNEVATQITNGPPPDWGLVAVMDKFIAVVAFTVTCLQLVAQVGVPQVGAPPGVVKHA